MLRRGDGQARQRLLRTVRPAGLLGILLVVLLVPAHASAEEAEEPVVRDIEIRGADAYSREALLRIIRLRPGAPLHRDAATVAASLETRYHDDGYPAARVRGDYDPDTGTLELSVDEGRLAQVVIPGLEGRA